MCTEIPLCARGTAGKLGPRCDDLAASVASLTSGGPWGWQGWGPLAGVQHAFRRDVEFCEINP